MFFFIDMTLRAKAELEAIEQSPSHLKRLKAVRKALFLLETNPRHAGLNTHKYNSKHGENGEEVFEAFAENNAPGAYRIFLMYAQAKGAITTVPEQCIVEAKVC